jgi:indolepyruvate ferredoxin oxidoreductase alpha subunit
MVDLVEKGFELSEVSRTPVMLMMRIRACHMVGSFATKDNRPPPFTVHDALATPQRSFDNIILPPSTYAQERQKIVERWPAAQRYIQERRLNEIRPGRVSDLGIVVQGGLFNTLARALERLGLADIYGAAQIPIYVLNVTYPLVDDELLQFAAGKRALLVVEEGQPEFIEQAIAHILSKAESATRVVGKGPLPKAGEYTGAVVLEGLRQFVQQQSPSLLAPPNKVQMRGKLAQLLASDVPIRPSGLCTGCPERPLFSAMKLVERELGKMHVSADIGCHSFATLAPFDMGASIMGYGLGPAGAAALNTLGPRRAVSLMGDGGFWHNGLTSGIGNAVFNQHDGITIVVDNGYSAATGGQSILSSRSDDAGRDVRHDIEAAVRGIGIQWVRRIGTYNMRDSMRVLREAFTTPFRGPKVILAEGECQLNRQRREAPLKREREQRGERVVRQQFGVDPEVCTGDHSCIRLSGCPSLTLKDSNNPLRPEPIAHVDQSCVGCGVCGEVAHAAVLCPSFYRLDIIANPRRHERWLARWRRVVIGWLTSRREPLTPAVGGHS